MKNLSTILFVLICLVMLGTTAWGQLYDGFPNTDASGNIGGTGGVGSTANGWTTHSGTTGTITSTSTSLTYTGLQASTGYSVYVPGNNTTCPRDVNTPISGVTTTVAYWSALVNIVDNTQLGTTGDYFMGFGATAGSSVSIFGGRVGVKSVNSGANFRFTITNASGGTPTLTDNGADLTFGTTYLVVVKYDRGAIPTVATMWINPSSLGGSEPTGGVTNSSGTGTFSGFLSIFVRNTTGTPKAYYDEVRAGTTWASVTPAAATNSSSSDIIANVSFTYPTNIAYASNTGTDVTSSNPEVFELDIRDGGGSADGDALSTTLTAITLSVTNWSVLEKVALYDGISELGEVTASGSITFSGLSVAAADNGSYTLNLRATYKTTVTDNTQFSFTVTSATANPSGSTFAAGNAGGAASSTSGTNNQIEVTATKYNFSTQPPATTVVNTNFAAGVEALDANNNRDLDDATTATLAASAGTLSSVAGLAQPLSSGVYDWTDLQNNTAGTGVTLSATGTHTTANSSSMTIYSAIPTTSASSVNFGNVLTTSMDVNWTSGDGANRIVIAKSGSAVTFSPTIGTTYTGANADFTLGTDLGSGNILVYSGPNSTFNLAGLNQNTTYHVAVFEFNGSGGTENYKTTSPGTGSQLTAATVSTASDIIAAGNETADLDYASKQSATITTTSDGIRVWSFTIRDGGVSADADAFGTEMTSVTIDQGGSNGISNWSNVIRQATLFDGSTKIADATTIGSSSLAFTGLSGSNVTAADDGSKTLDLYLSFKTTVTDNEQFQFQITNGNVTAAGSSSSLFTTFSAQTSSLSGDADRIEVTATKLNFSTQPPSTTTVNTNFSSGVEALDANNNRDLDDATSVSLTASAGTLSSATGLTQSLSSGVYNWTDLQNNTAGTGVTLQATGGSLTLANSSAMTIYSAEPTSQASISGFSSVTTSSMTADLSAGDGSYRIVLAKSGSAVDANPVDGTTYSPSSTFSSGDQIGTGNYVIFAGSGTSAPVSGLSAGTTYHFAVFEFNGSGGTENYKTPSGTGSQMTSGETYTWNQTGTASWAVSTNWTPTRTTPATNDILQFNGGATVTATNVPIQTIGQLLVSNSTTVNLQAAGTVTLTISGGSGVDLSVAAGSALNCNVANAITIFVGTGATGSISGTMTYTSAAHKLNAQDASAITFQSGAIMTQGTGMTGNIFTNSGTANVVIFANGSIFVFQAGSNPFGLSAPNSKVVFQTGSLYRHETTGFPSLDNRVYANYEYNASGTCSPNSGTTGTTMEDLTVTQGTFNLNPAFTTNIKGDVTVAGGAALGFSASTAATVNLNGTSTQTISGGGTLTFGANTSITVASGADVVLSKSFAVSQTITVNGTLDCGTSVISGTGGSVSVSNGATLKVGSTSGSGAIDGNVTATGGVTLASGSTVEVNGSAAQYLAARTFDDLTVNNSSGVSLVGNITMNDILSLSNGDLTTGGYTVNLGSTGTLSETAGNTVIGNVTVTRTVASPQTFGGIGFEMNSNGPTHPGSTAITRVTGQGQGPAAQSVKRYFDITPTNNSGLDVDATFYYDESELNGRDEPTLEMWKSIDNGANWTQQGGTPNATNNTVVLNGVSSFSRWTLTDAANPLVVTGSQSSDVVAGVLSIPATISSLIDTDGEKIAVFDFKVRDGGASGDADLTGTLLNSIRVIKGASNTVADWSATIQGAELFDGLNSLGVATLHVDSLSWSGSPIVTVPDDNNLTLTVKIYLKTSMPAGSDGKVFEFQINQNANVTVGGSGSYMAPGGSDVVGTPGTTIDVQATQLAFTTQPQSGLLVGSNIAPVAVSAQDANSNTDGGYSGNVTLSSGTFTLASTDVGGLTQAATAGVASWTNLTSSTSGTGTILADASSMTQGVSNSISVLPAAVTSITSGSWSSGTTWSTGAKPTPTQSAVIATGHTVTMTATDTCEALTVQTGGVLDLATFALQLRGTFTLQAGAEAKVSAFNPLPGNGPTPYAFDLASNFEAYGGASGFGYRNPSVQTVTFGNVHWNSTGNATPSGTMIVAGNLTKSNIGELRCGTGSSTSRTVYVYGNITVNGGILLMSNSTAPITGALDVNGDLTINSSGKLRGVNYTGSGTLKIGGNLINNGGTIEVDDGSGSGDFIVYFKGTGNTNLDPGATNAFRTVNIAPGRTVNLINNNMTINSTYTFSDTGRFNCGTTIVTGAGNFTLLPGATLGIGSPDGITTSGTTGNIQVVGTRTFDPAANYVYNGSVAQVTGNGFPANCNNLTIDNTAGVTLSSNHAVNGVLTFTNGNVITGIDSLFIGETGSVSRTSGHVVGNLNKYIASGGAKTFEIGDATYYSPVNVTFGTVTTPGKLTVATTRNHHSEIASSGIDVSKMVNRYYTFTNNGVVFDNYNAAFTFASADIEGGADWNKFVVKKYDGVAWSSPTIGTRGETSTQITGVTSFSDFAIGEPVLTLVTYQLSVIATAGGTITVPVSPPITVNQGDATTITALANVNYHFVNWTNPVGTAVITNANAISTTVTLNVGDATVQANFAVNTYTLAVTVVGSGTVTKDPDQPTYEHGTHVELTAVPAHGWILSAWSVDASGSANPLDVTMDGIKNITATFIENPVYQVQYRSFDPDSIVNSKDLKGKYKYIARKANACEFEFDLTAPGTAAVTLKFSMVSSGAVMRGTEIMATWIDSKTVTPTEFVDSGDVIHVIGWGISGKPVKTGYSWATLPRATKGTVGKESGAYTMNQPRLPMPNRLNALYDAFALAAFPTGLLVGQDKTLPDSTKLYGWLNAPKAGDIAKTLNYKGTHTAPAHGFDIWSTTKPFLKRQKSITPPKYNNVLLAQMISLKLNIAASAMEMLPLGYGELIFDDATLTPPVGAPVLNGLMVKEVASLTDSIMMGWTVVDTIIKDKPVYSHHFVDATVFAYLNTAITKINNAFEGQLDTLKFSDTLQFTGVKKLIDVEYLKGNSSVMPARIIPNYANFVAMPEQYTLYQNYPNPFNPTTMIQFDLPEDAMVTLKIYNLLGQEVATLLDREAVGAGAQEVEFSAQSLASGVYFYRIVAETANEDDGTTNMFQTVKKMILMK